MCCSSEDENLSEELPSVLKHQCPNKAPSNGRTCTVNAVGDCPDGYTCIPMEPDTTGVCCRTLPKCKRGKEHFIGSGQVSFLYSTIKTNYFLLFKMEISKV